VWSLSYVDHGWQCVLVLQVVYIWGTGATDRGNDVWVTGRSYVFYLKQDTPEGDQEVYMYIYI